MRHFASTIEKTDHARGLSLVHHGGHGAIDLLQPSDGKSAAASPSHRAGLAEHERPKNSLRICNRIPSRDRGAELPLRRSKRRSGHAKIILDGALLVSVHNAQIVRD